MQAINLVTGVTPTCWRPPYGDVDVCPSFCYVYSDTDLRLTLGPCSLYCTCTELDNYRLEV